MKGESGRSILGAMRDFNGLQQTELPTFYAGPGFLEGFYLRRRRNERNAESM